MEKACSLVLWCVLVCRIAIITDSSKGDGTVPHCKYTGRFGDLTAYWQEIVSDAVYLFRLGESEECDWLVLLGQPWSPYSPDGIR